MTSTLSTLTEKITLLEDSTDTTQTTTSRFNEVVTTRAAINPISSKLFEIVIPKPPVCLKRKKLSAIRWNNSDYICDSPFSAYSSRFIRGKVRLLDR